MEQHDDLGQMSRLNDIEFMDALEKEHQKILDKKEVFVEVKDLKMHFPAGRNKTVKAVDGLNFQIYRGETFGLVGESGCGKTTAGRAMIGIYKPTGGDVIFDGENTKNIKSSKEIKEFKSRAQMIFQDPYASLDPRMTIDDIIEEGIAVHYPKMTEKQVHDRISSLLEIVGLNAEHGARFPHELSGGQRQRIGVARALAVKPDFIVCDEPISALDVSIQAQVVNLLNYLQWSLGLTYLFISHDLSMVQHISDRIGVMYLGNLVELTTNNELYKNPLHPYTKALMSAIPVADPDAEKKERIRLEGEVPSPINPPKGCAFAPRCSECMEICKTEKPEWKEVGPEHWVSCHLFD